MDSFMFRSNDYIIDSPSKGKSSILISWNNLFIRFFFPMTCYKSNLIVSLTPVVKQRDGRLSYFSGRSGISSSITGIHLLSNTGDTGKTSLGCSTNVIIAELSYQVLIISDCGFVG